MRKGIFIFVLATVVLCWVNLAEAQQAEKVYRIGFLDYRLRSSTTDPRLIALRQGLRELGYVEGQNYVIEYRSAKGEDELLPVLAAELARLKLDVIITSPSDEMVHVWQQATRTIPIVMGGIRIDPVEAGLVVSLARPGGNITGLTNLDFKLHGKRLELLKEVSPGVSRAAILWPESQQEQGMKEVEAVGQALGIKIQSVDTWDGLDSAFSEISEERADALVVANSALALIHRARIIEFTAKRRLPTIYARSEYAKAGGLMSYSANRKHLLRRQAIYVDKILKGAKPGNLPIEQPTKFELVINLKTAKQIGVTIPREVLFRADKVIK